MLWKTKLFFGEMTFREFQGRLSYFLINALASETTHTHFCERHLLENSENLFKALIELCTNNWNHITVWKSFWIDLMSKFIQENDYRQVKKAGIKTM